MLGITGGRRRTTESIARAAAVWKIQVRGFGGVVELSEGGGETDPKLGNRECMGLSRLQTKRKGCQTRVGTSAEGMKDLGVGLELRP